MENKTDKQPSYSVIKLEINTLFQIPSEGQKTPDSRLEATPRRRECFDIIQK